MHPVMITVVGNVRNAPELSVTRNGTTLATFGVISTSRRYDRQADGHVTGDSMHLLVQCSRGLARNAAATLEAGSPVVVQGRLVPGASEPWGQDGRRRWQPPRLEAIALGLDLARLPLAAGAADLSSFGEAAAPGAVA